MTNVLFVTWDGPHSPYLESLFLPIFAGLATHGYRFHVLQFTWGKDDRAADACAAHGVPYRRVDIWRRPVAAGSFVTAIAGGAAVRKAVRDWDIAILVPRSYLPALAVRMARCGLPVLLDADGLPNDERIEFAGASPASPVHRLLSALERRALRDADAIMVRTAPAIDLLSARSDVPRARFFQVGNGRDVRVFTPPSAAARQATRVRLGVDAAAPLLVYAGSSMGGKYLGERMIAFAQAVRARRGDARLLLLTPEKEDARDLLAVHPSLDDGIVIHAPPSDVPALLGAADVGLSLIRATPSMRAATAVKTGEYLLCGVPVVATRGVGGIEDFLEPSMGFIATTTDDAEIDEAANWFVDRVLPDRAGFAVRCRQAGLQHFSLDATVAGYAAALATTLGADGR